MAGLPSGLTGHKENKPLQTLGLRIDRGGNLCFGRDTSSGDEGDACGV